MSRSHWTDEGAPNFGDWNRKLHVFAGGALDGTASVPSPRDEQIADPVGGSVLTYQCLDGR